MSAELWAGVVGLALVDTLSPATLAITIAVLLSGRAIVPRTIVYLTTLGCCYFLFGVALMLGLGIADVPTALGHDASGPWVTALGVVLIVISFVIDPGTKSAKRERRRLAAERAAARRRGELERAGGGGLLAMVGLGATTFALEFLTVVPYVAATGLMSAAAVGADTWVVALVVYNAVMVTPSLLLLGVRLSLGDRVRERFNRWWERLDAAKRPAAAWVLGAAGFLLVVAGATDLLEPAGEAALSSAAGGP